MDDEIYNTLLQYLEKEGPTNTFRLSRELGISRDKVLNIIGALVKKEAIEFKSGNAIFLRYPKKEKQVKKITSFKKKTPIKRITPPKPILDLKLFENLQRENRNLKKNLLDKEEIIKELEKKANLPPQIIEKKIIKKVPVIKEVIKKVRVTKKVPVIKEVQVIKKIKIPVKEKKIEKFKLPKLRIFNLKSIQQLNVPKILKGGL